MAYIGRCFIHALLLSLLVPTAAQPVIAQQKDTRVALVIGNASYPDAEAPLRDPVNNARALAAELRRSGFAVDVGENLTKEAMREPLIASIARSIPARPHCFFSAATASSPTGRPTSFR